MRLAKIYKCTKFDVYTFTRSKFTEGVGLLKFKNKNWPLLGDPDHVPFGVFVIIFMRWDFVYKF